MTWKNILMLVILVLLGLFFKVFSWYKMWLSDDNSYFQQGIMCINCKVDGIRSFFAKHVNFLCYSLRCIENVFPCKTTSKMGLIFLIHASQFRVNIFAWCDFSGSGRRFQWIRRKQGVFWWSIQSQKICTGKTSISISPWIFCAFLCLSVYGKEFVLICIVGRFDVMRGLEIIFSCMLSHTSEMKTVNEMHSKWDIFYWFYKGGRG